MKKITKTLALSGALLLSSVGLVACGGGGDLVNTKANYEASSAQATSAYLDELDEVVLSENQSIKVRAEFNIEMDLGELGLMTTNSKLNGNHSSTGDFYYTTSATSSMAGEKASSTGIVAYDTDDMTVYVGAKAGDKSSKLKYQVTDADDAFDYSGMGAILDSEVISTQGIKDAVEEFGEDVFISLAETDSYVKIKYEGIEDFAGMTYYVVFNKTGEEGETLEFAGVRIEFDFDISESMSAEGYIEFVLSNEAVKKLSDSEKAKYDFFSGFDY